MLKFYYPHTLFDYDDDYLFPKVSQYKILNFWLSITFILFLIFMLLNVCYSFATFGNTPKVDTKATMNANKKKNQY